MVGLRDIRQISVSGTVPDSYKQKNARNQTLRLITGAKIRIYFHTYLVRTMYAY